MVNFVIKHEGKKIKARAPSNWEEVTVRQFLDVEKVEIGDGNYLKALSVITGVELPILYNTRQDLQIIAADALNFLTLRPVEWEKLKKPKYLIFKGKKYKPPKDLSGERFGQFIFLKNKINEVKDIREAIPYAIAVYFQSLIDKEFIETRVNELEKEVEQMSIMEIFPLASFFLSKLIVFLKYGQSGLNPYPLTPKI